MAKSLAAAGGALSTELKLPSIFQAPPSEVVGRSIAPYITFAHPKRADEWAKLTAKFGQVVEGDMYLIRREGLVALALAKVSWMCCQQYWGEANAAGELLRASFTETPKPFKEHIEAVALVYLEDCVIPVNVCFRSTKCPGAKVLNDALVEAATPVWAEKSSQHKETLVCVQPFARFYGLLSLSPQRTSKSTGLTYRTTTCAIHPTTPAEWRLLKAFSENEDATKMLNDAAQRYESRLNEIKSKVGK